MSSALSLHLEEDHASSKAKYIKNIIYGGLDGIITTFAIIAAAVGASLDPKYIIAMGFANLFADGVSMGMGDYISSVFENKYILSEKKKEEIEFEINNEYETNEMLELYENEGLNAEDSKKIVDILKSKPEYKPLFIKYMLKMELGLDLPDKDDNPKKKGLITAVSFLSFGFIPVLFYLIFYLASYDNYTGIFIINSIITTLSLFGLGFFQAKIGKQNGIKGGVILVFNGVCAASIAFLLGFGIDKALS